MTTSLGDNKVKKNDTIKVEICKWDKHQDDRTKVWFKVRNDIFLDQKFFSLNNAAKVLWLYLCSQRARGSTKDVLINYRVTTKHLQMRYKELQNAVFQLQQNQMVSIEICTDDVLREDKKREEKKKSDATSSTFTFRENKFYKRVSAEIRSILEKQYPAEFLDKAVLEIQGFLEGKGYQNIHRLDEFFPSNLHAKWIYYNSKIQQANPERPGGLVKEL